MRSRVLDAASAAGRDPAEITCAYNVALTVGPGVATDAETVSGSAAAVTDQLASFIDLGFSTINLMPRGVPMSPSQTELLATEVIPALHN